MNFDINEFYDLKQTVSDLKSIGVQHSAKLFQLENQLTQTIKELAQLKQNVNISIKDVQNNNNFKSNNDIKILPKFDLNNSWDSDRQLITLQHQGEKETKLVLNDLTGELEEVEVEKEQPLIERLNDKFSRSGQSLDLRTRNDLKSSTYRRESSSYSSRDGKYPLKSSSDVAKQSFSGVIIQNQTGHKINLDDLRSGNITPTPPTYSSKKKTLESDVDEVLIKTFKCQYCKKDFETFVELHKHRKTHESVLNSNVLEQTIKSETLTSDDEDEPSPIKNINPAPPPITKSKKNNTPKPPTPKQIPVAIPKPNPPPIQNPNPATQESTEPKELLPLSTEDNLTTDDFKGAPHETGEKLPLLIPRETKLRHIAKTSKTKGFECKECPLTTHSRAEFDEHVRTSCPRQLPKCQFCSNIYPSKYHLRLHVDKEHTTKEDKIVSCDQCPFVCNKNSRLMLHVKTRHLKEFDYQCEKCVYVCSTISKLNHHVKTVHDKIKEFQCQECAQFYSTSYNLTAHMKTVHWGIKMHSCNLCPFQTNRKGMLTLHMNDDHGQGVGDPGNQPDTETNSGNFQQNDMSTQPQAVQGEQGGMENGNMNGFYR